MTPGNRDTSAEANALSANRFRTMSVLERIGLLNRMCADVDTLARLGIRQQYGGPSAEREHWVLMARRYGRPLAQEVLGDEPNE
jgi:hypothetical protein